jgi:hypothetical protein
MYFVGKIFKFILKYSVAALLQHTTHAKLKKEIVEHENFTNATRKPLLKQSSLLRLHIYACLKKLDRHQK